MIHLDDLFNKESPGEPCVGSKQPTAWLWLEIKQEGLRRFSSMFPLTRIRFFLSILVPFLLPQPHVFVRLLNVET